MGEEAEFVLNERRPGNLSQSGLQAERLASRPGYLALAVDGATPQSRFGRLLRRRHSGTIAG